MTEQNNKFNYTYSAAQKEEIDKIRKKYLPNTIGEEKDKMEMLRTLDERVTKKAMIPALTVGIIGALIMGIGMSLILTDICDFMGTNGTLILGIIVGMIGIAAVLMAYPLYHRILTKERKNAAPEILRLTNELLQN